MSTCTKFVQYSTEWKMRWSEYESMKISSGFGKRFTTPYKNIPLRWSAQIRRYKKDDGDSWPKFSISYEYNDGPKEKIDGVEYEVGIVKPDGTIRVILTMRKRPVDIGCFPARFNLDLDPYYIRRSEFFRVEYGLNDADRLVFQITIKIPVDKFSYTMPTPISKPCSPWTADMFKTIDDPKSAIFSDAKLISRNDVVYNCHKIVIAAQSEPLATRFRDPLEEGQRPPATKNTNESTSSVVDQSKTKKGEYDFPTMDASSLKAMIEFLYTGNATMGNLTVAGLIELADAAEQYALESLKQWSGAEMWKRVVDEPPMAFQIVRFADLHDDMVQLKYRAFDVIAENLDSSMRNFAKLFGGTRGQELQDEFNVYMVQRLRPYIKA